MTKPKLKWLVRNICLNTRVRNDDNGNKIITRDDVTILDNEIDDDAMVKLNMTISELILKYIEENNVSDDIDYEDMINFVINNIDIEKVLN